MEDEDAVDNGTADAVNYEYDSLGRLIHSTLVNSNGISMLTEHLYDRQNRIEKQTWLLRNTDDSYTTYTEEYEYRASDGSIKKMVPAIGKSVSFDYDEIARLSNQSNEVYSRTYNYKNIDSNQTTTQIESITYAADGTSFVPFTLTYSYDLLGNISAISCAQLPAQNTSYEYDEQGQMVIENINGNRYRYEYDTYGNLRAVYQVDGNIETQLHSYEYGNSEWLDLLTEFDNEPIYYDEIGNPTSYYNGIRWDFEWVQGRQLTKASRVGKTIDYTYDMAGIRDSKTVKKLNADNQVTDTVTYKYLTLSGKVMRQTWEDEYGEEHVINFAYDNTGRPYAFTYEGDTYYYVLNQQGDVIRIVDANGVTKAQYQYNAWGKILGTTGELAEVNPLRYRGYYYDTETGFYYLQSRYYDPGTGRFINADSFASTGQGFLGYNMFAYCRNSPVFTVDTDGHRTYFLNGIMNRNKDTSPYYVYAFQAAMRKYEVHDIVGIPLYTNQTQWSVGMLEVINEMLNIYEYTNSTVEWIENDLAENPLAEGEQLNLIGYSGGGQVALNVAEKLSYKVDNVILIGAPVFEIFTADSSVLVIEGGWDPLSIPCVLSGKMTTYLAGWYSHEGYFDKANINTTARIVADFLSR